MPNLSTEAGIGRVDHAESSGSFTLDGETHQVDNNIWVVGDETECVIIDAPHSVRDILAVVGKRKVKAILLTHAHDDHCRAAPALRDAVGAPIALHPADQPLWELTHPQEVWDLDLNNETEFTVGGLTLRVLHTPGHSPGAVCFYAPDLGCVFTGDTLFRGGPGATGRSYSDATEIAESIQQKLFTLPASTVVHAGHGEGTTVSEERALVAATRIRAFFKERLPGEESIP